MRNLYVSIFFCFISLLLTAQGCLPEGITFTTQEQIDNFQSDYPGCTEIEGGVIINGEDIVNLTGLNVITSIGGYLQIGGQNMYYEGNPLLENLSGLENLTSLGGGIVIIGNDLLTDVSVLSNLITVGIPSNVWIIQNASLNNILGLDVFSVCSNLRILHNPNLTSLEGLENITHVTLRVIIDNNDSLIDLAGLEGLSTVGYQGISILNNNAMTSLSGLENVVDVEGLIEIYSNSSLENLAGLSGISNLSGGIEIRNNSSLTSLSGLENLSTIEGDLNILSNGFINLEGLNNLTAVQGNVLINKNPSLYSLSGLDELTNIGGGLSIGEFTLQGGGNSSLNNIASLNNLTSIDGYLSIFNNDSLSSLVGMENIDAGSINGLNISGNYNLSNCHIANICNYLAAPNGTISITNNAPGCNSEEEVEEACETVSIDEFIPVSSITSFPNPFSTSTTLSYTLKQPSTVQFSVFNQLGQLVYSYSEEQQQGEQQLKWDAQGLVEGIYYYRLKAGDRVANGKMVKVR